jgi:hypothetical protein
LLNYFAVQASAGDLAEMLPDTKTADPLSKNKLQAWTKDTKLQRKWMHFLKNCMNKQLLVNLLFTFSVNGENLTYSPLNP